MNDYLEKALQNLISADPKDKEDFRKKIQHVSQGLEHVELDQEQYDRTLAVLKEKEKLYLELYPINNRTPLMWMFGARIFGGR